MPNKHLKNYSFHYSKKLDTTVHLPNWNRFAVGFVVVNNLQVLMEKWKSWHLHTLLVGV